VVSPTTNIVTNIKFHAKQFRGCAAPTHKSASYNTTALQCDPGLPKLNDRFGIKEE